MRQEDPVPQRPIRIEFNKFCPGIEKQRASPGDITPPAPITGSLSPYRLQYVQLHSRNRARGTDRQSPIFSIGRGSPATATHPFKPSAARCPAVDRIRSSDQSAGIRINSAYQFQRAVLQIPAIARQLCRKCEKLPRTRRCKRAGDLRFVPCSAIPTELIIRCLFDTFVLH